MPRMQRPMILLAAALALLALASPAEAARRKVPHGFFAVMYDRATTDASDAAQEQQWALMASSGVESVRTVFSWARTQPQPGVTDFSYTDKIVALAARHDIDLVPVVRTSPGWAALNPFQRGSPPKNTVDYSAFLRVLIERYGPKGSFWVEHPELPRKPVRYWQIWNEPHLNVWWNTDGRSPNAWAGEYAALLKAVAPVIRTADPGAKIVLCALADFAWNHLARLNKFKISRYYDIAAINLFTASPSYVIRGVKLFRRVMRQGGAARKPVWLTESTWPAGKGRVSRPATSWQRAWYTTDKGMATRLRDMYALAAKTRRKLKIGKVVWYTWSSAYHDGADLFDYGGLNVFDGSTYVQQPALAAYAKTARKYEGCRKTAAGACRR
jgi:polysaccharide biosynthesis protein PslG